MKNKNYSFAGELNFNNSGNAIPPEKNGWVIKGKEASFTIVGFLYFQHGNGKREDNVVFFNYADLERGGAYITCYATNSKKSKEIMTDLRIFTKSNNCLRGAKLKDINIISASFSEVELSPDFNWDNYYFPQNIIDLFDLEVFGFVNNTEQYNKEGIFKRGLILSGKPGTGKTTIGNIICNYVPDHTVIWITPEILSENAYKAMSSIKSLYKLADFLSPCIIILEDLDLFAQDREKGGDIIGLGALMNVLDGINSIVNSVTIATTNRINIIEQALRNRPGRFDRIVEVPPLSSLLRRKMLKDRLKSWSLERGLEDFLVNKTENWTGAEMQGFVDGVNLGHIASKKKRKRLTTSASEEVIETMRKFGIGEASSQFGFSNKED